MNAAFSGWANRIRRIHADAARTLRGLWLDSRPVTVTRVDGGRA